MSKHRILLLCLPLAASLLGCAAPGQYQPALELAPPLDHYPVAAGDRLRVIVFGQDQLSNSYAVDGSGRIAMPLIGSVPVYGRDPAAVEREIAARLRKGYLRDPRVSV